MDRRRVRRASGAAAPAPNAPEHPAGQFQWLAHAELGRAQLLRQPQRRQIHVAQAFARRLGRVFGVLEPVAFGHAADVGLESPGHVHVQRLHAGPPRALPQDRNGHYQHVLLPELLRCERTPVAAAIAAAAIVAAAIAAAAVAAATVTTAAKAVATIAAAPRAAAAPRLRLQAIPAVDDRQRRPGRMRGRRQRARDDPLRRRQRRGAGVGGGQHRVDWGAGQRVRGHVDVGEHRCAAGVLELGQRSARRPRVQRGLRPDVEVKCGLLERRRLR